MNGTTKAIKYKKAYKCFLICLEITAVTLLFLTGSFLMYAESQGYRILKQDAVYEESNIFFGEIQSALDQILEPRELKDGVVIYPEYQEGFSNLAFVLVLPEEKKIYSNRQKYTKYAGYQGYLTEIADSNWHMTITESSVEADGWDAHHKLILHDMLSNYLGNHSFIFAASLDTEYPIQDVFAERFEEYQKLAEWLPIALVISVLSAAASIICLILLTISTGRVSEDEEIHLNFFDRWYTEPSAFLVLFLWVIVCMPVVEEFFPYVNGIETMIGCTIIGFWSICCFLVGYLSLVRRIKARILWKRSLIYYVFHNGKKILRVSGKTSVQAGKRVWGSVRKTGGFGYRLLKEGFLDNMSDLAKLCMGSGLLLLLHILLLIAFVRGRSILFFVILVLIDLCVIAGILFYGAMEIRVKKGLKKIASGELESRIEEKGLLGYQKEMAESINQIGEGMRTAVQESIRNERMKTELITNVSHDIKTPLTSIINYIDLLKRENLENEKAQGYIQILEEKSQRLKILTEDVVEASRASTGNVTLEMADLDFVELIQQVAGEYEEKFSLNDLKPVFTLPELPLLIYADGRRMWRILSNVFGNAAKYSLEGTRVYIDLMEKEQKAVLFIKNISRDPLNISAEELTERFVRGDQSRTTEGSGLGLSIAKSFTELMGGSFTLSLDGDLFKVTITFPIVSHK